MLQPHWSPHVGHYVQTAVSSQSTHSTALNAHLTLSVILNCRWNVSIDVRWRIQDTYLCWVVPQTMQHIPHHETEKALLFKHEVHVQLDWQCKYDVILRRFRVTQWKSNKYYIFWVCLYSLKIRMPYAYALSSSVVCPALYSFSTLSHKGTILEKKSLNIKRVSLFPVQLLSVTFFILRSTEQDLNKFASVFL
jgi:hypothetical protein